MGEPRNLYSLDSLVIPMCFLFSLFSLCCSYCVYRVCLCTTCECQLMEGEKQSRAHWGIRLEEIQEKGRILFAASEFDLYTRGLLE